jgi:ABC-type multidrug transport system fused ATPase/permease subunit
MEMGNHEELMRDFPKGIYAGFCEKQASAEADGAQDDN